MTVSIDEVCVYIEKSQQSISEILEHNPFVKINLKTKKERKMSRKLL